MKTAAEQLRDWMGRRGFNQEETADFFGWPRSFVSMLVNGQRSPGLLNAVLLEEHTGIPVKAWVRSRLHESNEPELVAVGRPKRHKA